MIIEQRLINLGISLPLDTAPAANYANAVLTGNLLFISGKSPLAENGKLPKGKLGREFSVEDGYRFATSAAINLIAVMKIKLGSLERVTRSRCSWTIRATSTRTGVRRSTCRTTIR